MICQDILKEAEKLVAGDRQEDYGDKLTNHENIANFWSAYLNFNVTECDKEHSYEMQIRTFDKKFHK